MKKMDEIDKKLKYSFVKKLDNSEIIINNTIEKYFGLFFFFVIASSAHRKKPLNNNGDDMSCGLYIIKRSGEVRTDSNNTQTNATRTLQFTSSRPKISSKLIFFRLP